MKSLFLSVSLSLWVAVTGLAQDQTWAHPLPLESIAGYPEAIVADKALLLYNPQTSTEEVHTWLKQATEVFATLQPAKPLAPGRFLARLQPGKTWRDAMALLMYPSRVNMITPWLKDKGGNERGVLNEVYVKLKPGQDEAFLLGLSQKYKCEIREREDMPGVWELYIVGNWSYNALEMALFLNQQPEVEFADVNYAFFPQVHTNDSLYARQWALQNVGGAAQGNGTPGADMDLVNAWNITTGDSAIRVAILDSGVDTLHPDLIPNLLPGYDATGGGSQGYPNTHFPSDGHGTACAGIVAAQGNNNTGIAGVAYTSSLLPVKVFYYIDTTVIIPGIVDTTLHEIPYSETAYLLGGINWAWQTGGADILSNSWGIPPDLLPLAPISQPVVTQAIQNASQQGRGGKGAIPLFSSGNDNGSLIWPANNTAHLISVGATTNKDKRASFSNYGTGLDVTAPGVFIATTDMLDTNGFAAGAYTLDFGGTSAACPHAAGVAALLLSEYPDLTFSQVRSALRVSAERVGGYAYDSTTVDGTWGLQLGYGRINAHQALLAVPVLSQPVLFGSVSVSVFPNPTASVLTLWLNGLAQKQVRYEVVDLAGKKVHEGRFFCGADEYGYSLSVEAWASGLYHLRIHTDEGLLTVKFVKN